MHGSNAIEGNSLSPSEVFEYVINNRSPAGKSENELLQTRNHFRTKQYLDSYAGKVNEPFVKEVHKRLLSGVDGYDGEERAGEYRIGPARITKGTSPIYRAEDIQQHMSQLVLQFDEMIESKAHSINCFAVFHHQMEKIHPFREGNGRTGRAILDYMLRKDDFPPIYISPKKRVDYLNALQEGDFQQNYAPLVDFIIERMCMTQWYFISRSKTMRRDILSSDYKAFFESHLGTNDMYQKMVDVINHFQTTDEDP